MSVERGHRGPGEAGMEGQRGVVEGRNRKVGREEGKAGGGQE
jgi:hypothetical protein